MRCLFRKQNWFSSPLESRFRVVRTFNAMSVEETDLIISLLESPVRVIRSVNAMSVQETELI